MSVEDVILGKARWHLELGDCLEGLARLPAGCVDAVLADPPYSSGALHIGGKQKDTSTKYTSPTMGHWSQDKGYPAYCGDNCDQMTWVLFARSWLMEAYRASKEGAHLYLFCDWRQLSVCITAMQMGFWQYRGIVVWDKGNSARAPLAGLWRHGAEFMLWGAKGQPWSVTGGEWLEGVAPVHNVLSENNVRNKEHVTQKPVSLLRKVVEICSPVDGLILDPFSGSATTGIASLLAGRKFLGWEVSPVYHALATRRLEETDAVPPLVAAAERSLFDTPETP
jgi:site-specific DNA-methyltransferase (adenine-specific)